VEVEDVPSFHVKNYPAPPAARKEMTRLIHNDRDVGWLIKRARKPRHTTACLHHVIQNNKLRLVTDFSEPIGESTQRPATRAQRRSR
jgi:hypothetical protein